MQFQGMRSVRLLKNVRFETVMDLTSLMRLTRLVFGLDVLPWGERVELVRQVSSLSAAAGHRGSCTQTASPSAASVLAISEPMPDWVTILA
jgi:hypothetical protein